MMSDVIQRSIQGKVAVITLNAPPVNALDSSAYFDLYEAMYDFAVDDEIAVVVITGAGEKAFMAGADVKEFLKFNRQTGSIYTKKNSGVREYIRCFPKPVICAINGLALGGGCALALACDIRIACREAKCVSSACSSIAFWRSSVLSTLTSSSRQVNPLDVFRSSSSTSAR